MTNGTGASPHGSGGAPVSALWPADSPAVTAHIATLQGIINRLAGNSASCKTWCISLVAALVSLSGATRMPAIVPVALVPVVVFAFLDTMYLAQERAYRGLYAEVVGKVRAKTYDISVAFNVSAPLRLPSGWSAFFSWSIWPVYLGLVSLYVVARATGWLAVLAPRAAGG